MDGKTEAAPQLEPFAVQIERIRRKRLLAAQSPGADDVFGASSHCYRLNEPLTHAELDTLEQEWGVTLPEDFAAFVTAVGNGGPGSYGGAGPYYGIYAVGRMDPDLVRLRQPAKLKPDRTWAAGETADPPVWDEDLDDDAYDEALADLMRGTLTIGTMGCSSEMLLIVSGEHRGRVVYLDTEYLKPFFVYEKNFLDWYERWLDEVIAGFKIHWFAATPGGGETDLLTLAQTSAHEVERGEALKALLRFPKLSDPAIAFAKQAVDDPSDQVRYWALALLAAHAPDSADPILLEDLESGQADKRKAAVQLIHGYRKQAARTFAETLQAAVPEETDEETFRFATYILESAGIEPLPLLLPAFRSPAAEIRKSAIWQAGKSVRKADYVEAFIDILLRDPETHVQLTAIQALDGVKDKRLLPVYEQVLEQHPTNEHYIRSNVRHRLTQYGFNTHPKIERGVPADLTRVRDMLRDIMEEHG
ncbi:HEAT repeat domain-containing protein [Saccharibacillus deserti]|uniref:HEAT repeat domain-containing protein n=1 Tax=Saccharibacillus deserti TaxID=1634444 RepID=UPI0015574EAB|nr:HEAT repeat domain-containing protein [Saccharibacillus deserti]